MSQLIPKHYLPSGSLALAIQAPLALESQVEIDRICTDFEERWGTDQAVSIEHVLTAATEQLRPALFHQLLLIELELNDTFNLVIDEQHYLRLFPEYEAVVKVAFLETINVENNPLVSHKRYVLQNELARGGMGVVYRGWDSVLKRQVAIKVIDASLMQDREARLRFGRESRLCGNLQHPNIVPVYDIGQTENGLDFFVMKLINGQTLAEWLQCEQSKEVIASQGYQSNEDPRSWPLVLPVFLQIARAIASAHRIGVVHRDIKPANVMLAEHGEVYVMDWGLSGGVGATIPSGSEALSDGEKPINLTIDGKQAWAATEYVDQAAAGAGSHSSSLTTGGAVFGTLRYMPPELEDVNADRSLSQIDVYSLGAMLCEFLIGETPRQLFAESALEQHESLLRERLSAAQFDGDLISILARCIHHIPSARFASAGELVSELERYQQEAALRARNTELAASVAIHQSRTSRWRWRTFGVLSSGLALALISFSAMYQYVSSLRQGQRMDAMRAIEKAELAFLEACESQNLHSSKWSEAVRIHDSVREIIAKTKDPGLLERSRDLQHQLQLFQSLSFDRHFVFDDELKNFSASEFVRQTFDALDSFGIGPGHGNPENAWLVLERLDPTAQRLVASLLIENIRSEALDDKEWWFQLAELMEARVLGSTVYSAILDNDQQAIQQYVDDNLLENLSPPVLALLATNLQNVKDFSRAEKVYRSALTRYPTNFALATNFGDFLQHYPPKRPIEAIEYFGIAAAVDCNEGSLTNLVTCLLQCNANDRAFDLLQRHNGLQDIQVPLLLHIVKHAAEAGNYEAANKLLQSLEDRGEQLHKVYHRWSETKSLQGSWRSARQWIEKAAIASQDDPEYLPKIYSHYLALQLVSDAIAGLEELAETRGESYDQLFQLARAYQLKGDHYRAEQLYRKCISLQPHQAHIYCNLAFSLERLNRRDEAIQMFQLAHQQSEAIPLWPYDSLAWINNAKLANETAQNIERVCEVIKQSKNPTQTYLLIASHLRPMGRFDLAYELACTLSESLDDPKLWLTAASVAADYLHEHRSGQQTADSSVVSRLVTWLNRSGSQFERPITDSQSRKYYLVALREATQQLTYETLRSEDFAAQLPAEAQQALREFWKKVDTCLFEIEEQSE